MTRNFFFRASRYQLCTLLLFALAHADLHSQPLTIGLVDSAKIPKPGFHYLQEYSFDSTINPQRWQEQPPGLQAGFGTTDKAYFRTEVPQLSAEANKWQATGWRGERLNALILTWSKDTISQVRFVVSDFKNEKGQVLPGSQANLQLVRYVISNYPYDAGDVTCGAGPVDKAYLLPDRLEDLNRIDIPGKTVRPAWLSISIPATALPGHYKGKIEVYSERQKVSLDLTIQVQAQVLPPTKDWSFRLDLWQNPWVLAEYYKVKAWGAEHKNLLRQHMKLYADAGGKYITTYAVYSPWADNSYMIEGSMIEWIRLKNGKWKFDYSIFDQYVQLAMEAGINKAITIYTPIPWGERFRYLEEGSGNYITERWLPTSSIFKQNWYAFLTNLRAHLEKKGWFHKTFLGINENAMEQTLAAIKVIKEHSKDWKITYAGDWHPELDALLDDYSCVFGKEPGTSEVRQRANKKQFTTYYICCTPPKPNTFVFSPPVEGRWLGWYAFAYGYDGLLRWAYDAWPADPVRDARHVLWPAGDCFMVYPGAASSIRFEKMREGIVDFEKLGIIRRKASLSADPTVKKLMGELEARLKKITAEKKFDSQELEKDLREGKALLEALSDQLPYK